MLWKKLPLGEWYFSVGLSRRPVAVCDSHERTVTLQIAPPSTGTGQFVVNGAAVLLDIEPLAICETLDLAKPSGAK